MQLVEKPYKYKSIEALNPCIRVLTLLPGSFDDLIKIKIRKIRLSHAILHPYTALSYVWGSNKGSIKIRVVQRGIGHRRFLNVTANLHEALKHIRDEQARHVLWIDALCINQQDLAERATQVKLMAEIYMNAKSTIVWLCQAADASTLAIFKLQQWANVMGAPKDLVLDTPSIQRWVDANSKTSTAAKFFVLDGRELELGSSKTQISSDSCDFGAVHALVMRSWFQRLWIRQEIYHSRTKATVVCGRDSISWIDFEKGFLGVLTHQEHRFYTGKVLSNLEPFFTRAKMIAELTTVDRSVCNFLYVSSKSLCGDQRDRIFGILGIMPFEMSWFRTATRVDYEMPVGEVYARAAQLMIEHDQRLTLLRYCVQHSTERQPSWVPDWQIQGDKVQLASRQAGGGSVAHIVRIDASRLTVSGLEICQVEEVFEHGIQVNRTPTNTLAVLEALCVKLLAMGCFGDENGVTTSFTSVLVSNAHPVDAGRMGIHNWPFDRAREDTIRALKEIRKVSSTNLGALRQSDQWVDFVINCLDRIVGYHVATSSTKDLLIGPADMRQGDKIAVLLGLENPIVLRRASNNCHEVIGICSMPRLNHGQALLGELHDHIGDWKAVISFEQDEKPKDGYIVDVFNEIEYRDPRIEWQYLSVKKDDPRRNHKLSELAQRSVRSPDAEYFINRGVVFQDFELV